MRCCNLHNWSKNPVNLRSHCSHLLNTCLESHREKREKRERKTKENQSKY